MIRRRSASSRHAASLPACNETRLIQSESEIDRVGIVRIHFEGEAEIRRQTLADVIPRVTGIVAAIDTPMMLQKHSIGIRRVTHDLMHALAPFRILLIGRHEAGADTLIPWLPILPAIISPINAAGRNGYPHSISV